MSNYYNDFDADSIRWIEQMMADNVLTRGVLDARSIKSVRPEYLAAYDRCHFFAGIAGWEFALQAAGWPASVPVWTGSCPCQPYSTAGKRKGHADDRDLWPDFFRLIRTARPQCIFGEQVEGAIRFGWLDRVHTDLEAEGYTVGSVVLGAHSVGAPHIRQRLYWVAHAKSPATRTGDDIRAGRKQLDPRGSGGTIERVAHTDSVQRAGCDPGTGGGNPVEDHTEDGRGRPSAEPERPGGSGVVGMGDAESQRRESAATSRRFSDSAFITGSDGRTRRIPTEPALFPLAHGIPGRRRLLRGAGNAICVPTAAAFVNAFMRVAGITRQS